MDLESIKPTSEQEEFINLALQGKNLLVDACIGSGKTTTIQMLCNKIQDKNILYLTYNRLLKLDAKDKIQQKNTLVTNYNGFAFICLARAGISCGISDQFQVFNAKKPPLPRKYDILIIDEYQDIENEMVEMLEYIKEQNPWMQIIAVGDMDQKIYDKTALDVASFIKQFLGNYEKISFTRCFRLSSEIASTFGEIWGKPIIGVNEHCLVQTMSQPQVVKFLSEHEPREILCLGGRSGMMAKTLNQLELTFPQKFNKTTVYASISDGEKCSVEPDSTVAIFTTFDSSKGLERPICVVFDYTEDYWYLRTRQANTNQLILRNIFCVAGSRGKEHIIFVPTPGQDLVEPAVLKAARGKNEEYKKPFMASEMFDFKYREDVESFYKTLKTELDPISMDKSVIDIPNTDELIDIAPCIGHYQEAFFFKGYDLDEEVRLAASISQMQPRYRTNNPDIKEKILALTALQTRYDRYIRQANIDFISKGQEQALEKRLRQVFTGEENVQKDCSISIVTYDKNFTQQVLVYNGRIDVEKDGIIWELKFKNEVGHEDFLQLAFYLVANNVPYGYLWNVKTNTRYKVYKPEDEKAFCEKLLSTTTKQTHHIVEGIRKDTAMINISMFENDKKERLQEKKTKKKLINTMPSAPRAYAPRRRKSVQNQLLGVNTK